MTDAGVVMRHQYLEIATTPRRARPAVHAARWQHDGIDRYAGADGPVVNDLLGPTKSAFIAARDGFYLASVSEHGWPYMQHRGGPPGFLRMIDEHTLGVADFRGNKQYVTLGNTSVNQRQAFAWNCPQHIMPRFTEAEIATASGPLHRRVAELESEVGRRRRAT
jgi:hypothetical protein